LSFLPEMKCLDCGIKKIPDGCKGLVFLIQEDRAGEYVICSTCHQRRAQSIVQSELDRRRKIIEAETRESGKKKKSSSSRPGGSNRQGSQH